MRHSYCINIKKQADVVDGMIISDPDDKFDCEVCILRKMTQSRSRVPDAHVKKVFELVHLDLADPVDSVSVGGYRYALICIDDFSGLNNVYFFKNKSNSPGVFKKYLADISPYGFEN